MNRKEGIDYFPVKCAADNAIELVTAECGLKAHAVIYALLQEIYGVHGYIIVNGSERGLCYFRHECLAGVTKRSIV